jgi:hypothetical protein
MISKDKALELAIAFVNQGNYVSTTDPLEPRFIKGEACGTDQWIVEFPFDLPNDVIESPDSLLVQVSTEHGEIEVFRAI